MAGHVAGPRHVPPGAQPPQQCDTCGAPRGLGPEPVDLRPPASHRIGHRRGGRHPRPGQRVRRARTAGRFPFAQNPFDQAIQANWFTMVCSSCRSTRCAASTSGDRSSPSTTAGSSTSPDTLAHDRPPARGPGGDQQLLPLGAVSSRPTRPPDRPPRRRSDAPSGRPVERSGCRDGEPLSAPRSVPMVKSPMANMCSCTVPPPADRCDGTSVGCRRATQGAPTRWRRTTRTRPSTPH